MRPDKAHYTAGMGLQYQVPMTEEVYGFFGDLHSVWKHIAGDEEMPPKRGARSRYRFTLYDEPRFDDTDKALGLTVAELRISSGEAHRYGVRWATSDAGEMRTRILDGLNGLRLEAGLHLGPLTMRLSHAVPVGQRRGRGADRKFALVPDAEDPVAQYLTDAHKFVLQELSSRIPIDPDDHKDSRFSQNWIPHLTIGRVHNTVSKEGVAGCARALSGLIHCMPLEIQLAHEEVYDMRSQRQRY